MSLCWLLLSQKSHAHRYNTFWTVYTQRIGFMWWFLFHFVRYVLAKPLELTSSKSVLIHFVMLSLCIWQTFLSKATIFIQHLRNPRHLIRSVAPPAPHSSSTSVFVVITPACPPVDSFLRVPQQHQTGYKSHCIITAPCLASPCPAHYEPSIGQWGSLVCLSERDIGAIVHPASFLRARDWEKGALLELSIMFLPVRFAFSAAACDAPSAERRDALHTNRETGSRLILGQDAQNPSCSSTKTD